MAGKSWAAPDALALADSLSEQPWLHGYSASLRKLECVFNDRPRLGKSLAVKDEVVRLSQEPSMTFAPSTLHSFRQAETNQAARLSVNFFGLFGPNGPLPHHLTEYARERIRNHEDDTFSRFADLFHHRFLSLFYRAWADAQPTVSLDRPDADDFSNYVASLFGQGLPSLRNRDAMPDYTKLHFAGQLSGHTRHAEGLKSVLTAFFKIPVQIEEFVSTWFPLPHDSMCRLGETPETGTLGESAVLGRNIQSCQQKIRLVFGPLDYADFQRMLPGGMSLLRLKAIIKNYIGEEMVWDLRLILKNEEQPKWSLGNAALLGWTTLMGSRSDKKDIDEVLIHPVNDFG